MLQPYGLCDRTPVLFSIVMFKFDLLVSIVKFDRVLSERTFDTDLRSPNTKPLHQLQLNTNASVDLD